VDEQEKTPVEQAVEQAVEVFVYAPIGLLFEGASLLPQLVERGRNQVSMARMIGQFAVQQGKGEATKAVSRLQDQAAGVLDFLGDSVTPLPEDPAPAPAPAPAPRAEPAPAPAAAKKRPAAKKATPSAVDAGSLAIPDYDGLSASHVVNRLAGLSAAELEAVRGYEAANRGRKTILSKVQQLQSR
jgi:pyruvate/2-oxoglutarate dehydrogenase complex dihydrolipoamide acyltransferase (E2) component